MAEIRISKLAKQFSIGVQTLVEFLNEKGAERLLRREPTAAPGVVDADAEADRIDFLTHIT